MEGWKRKQRLLHLYTKVSGTCYFPRCKPLHAAAGRKGTERGGTKWKGTERNGKKEGRTGKERTGKQKERNGTKQKERKGKQKERNGKEDVTPAGKLLHIFEKAGSEAPPDTNRRGIFGRTPRSSAYASKNRQLPYANKAIIFTRA